MSLHGYKPKTRPAPWTLVHPPPQRQAKPRYIQQVSKRRQSVNAEYVREARAFVAAAVARGETCKVVAAIPELRNGHRYGWQVSDTLVAVHHRFGRNGALLMWKCGWMAISLAGHRWVHSNIDEARKHGWLCRKGLWNNQKVLQNASRLRINA